ncbi:MAG: hypothetical protein ACK5SZ_00990, partial [bacterium]
LVEMFPTRIRYTSMSLPDHIGNGVFGGLVPFAGTWISGVAASKFPTSPWIPFAGLIYPIGIALLTFVIGWWFIRERRDVKMWDERMDETVG